MVNLLKTFATLSACYLVVAQEYCGVTPELRQVVKKKDLQQLGNALFRIDSANRYGDVDIDQSPPIDRCRKTTPSVNNKLMTFSTNGIDEPKSYQLLRNLVGYYEEYSNSEEKRQAMDQFLDKILESPIITTTIDFLNHNDVKMDKTKFRQCLEKLWFSEYKRENSRSSGFQHVFMADLKRRTYSGFHNWIFYLDQQRKNNLIYRGHMNPVLVKDHIKVIRVCLEWKGHLKRLGSSMLVSASPELELALYTVCFLYRPGGLCTVSRSPLIQVLSRDFNATGIIATAYPMFT